MTSKNKIQNQEELSPRELAPVQEFQSQTLGFHDADQSRAMHEVQASIIVAQRVPRNENQAFVEVINACKRPSLAETAIYSYPRGGQQVSGPSIRLAEAIARHWRNLQYGIREISSNAQETKYEAFCWDVQTNVRASRVFTQRHVRVAKGKESKLTDPRDVYEIVANNAARRLRACILEILPSDLVESALKQCQETLKGRSDQPLKDRVRNMVALFNDYAVSEEMLAARLGHKIDACNEQELIALGKIYNSIKDGMSAREDWFKVDVEEKPVSELDARFGDETAQPTQ